MAWTALWVWIYTWVYIVKPWEMKPEKPETSYVVSQECRWCDPYCAPLTPCDHFTLPIHEHRVCLGTAPGTLEITASLLSPTTMKLFILVLCTFHLIVAQHQAADRCKYTQTHTLVSCFSCSSHTSCLCVAVLCRVFVCLVWFLKPVSVYL